MKVYNAKEKEILEILEIFKDAKEYIKNQGLIQWQSGDYPGKEAILEDITKKRGFVLKDNEIIAGYVAIVQEPEELYLNIKDGKWESDFQYNTIHRLALKKEYLHKNLSVILMDFAENEIKNRNIRSVRVDTSVKNENVKKIMKKRGYKLCGNVETKENGKMLLYEKLLIPYKVSDMVVLRKEHPCKNNLFEIVRVGMDIKLRCVKCNNYINLSRKNMEKNIKERIFK